MTRCLSYWPPLESAASLGAAVAFLVFGFLVGVWVGRRVGYLS